MAYYLIIINIISFTAVFADKQKAKHNKWRISEKTIFLLALSGGGAGVYASMLLFRHKIKKRYFKIGIPFIVILQIIIILYSAKIIY